MQLVMFAEIFNSNGYNTYSLSERTYNFKLSNLDRTKFDALCIALDSYEDVCFICKSDEINLVTYPNGISSERTTNVTLNKLNGNDVYNKVGVSYQSKLNEETLEIEKITEYLFKDTTLNIVGSVNVWDTYENGLCNSAYCSYDSFCEFISSDDEIVVSVLANDRLDEKGLNELKTSIRKNAGVFEYEALVERIDEFEVLISSNVGLIIILMIIIALSFSKLVSAILEKRALEYRVFRFCGATTSKIDSYKILHLLLIVGVSSVIGIVAFIIIRSLVGDYFIAYTRDSFFFYAFNVGIYLLISVITVVLGNLKSTNIVRKKA